MSEPAQTYWAIVELMGHRQRAALCQEVEQFGAKMLRIDIPFDDGATVTEFYGGSSIYALRPSSEEVARACAARLGDPRPIAPVGYRLEAPRAAYDEAGEYLDDAQDDELDGDIF